ncbi:type II secretion system F family protein [Streptomyces nitrosporeus]
MFLAALWSGFRRGRVSRRRGIRLVDPLGHRRPAGSRRFQWVSRDGARRWGPVAAAWVACWFLLGGAIGCGAGLVAAYGTFRWRRSVETCEAGAEDKAESSFLAAQLPLVADLLAACLSAGAGPLDAAVAVGRSVGGPVGDRLTRIAAEIRLGAEPSDAWGRLGEISGARPLARCLERAGVTGAPAAESVSRLADEMCAERASAAVARAQRAGVLITAPVGLCFLPAFLSVGVAPVVIGLADGLLHRG